MVLAEILETSTVILAAISIFVTVVIFLNNRKREIRVATLKAINELFEQFYEVGEFDINKNYKKCAWFLSKVDRFAATYHTKLFDKKIVKKRTASFLKRLYNEEGMRELIVQRRMQFKREEYYDCIEEMLREFD